MADRFIDLDETQFYGPYAARMIRARVKGEVEEFDAALEKVAADLEATTRAVGEALATARDTSSPIREGAGARLPVLETGLGLLERFSRHLDGHEAGAVDRQAFFAEGGAPDGGSRSGPRVLITLARILSQLGKPGCRVRDADQWRKQVTEAIDDLTPLLEYAQVVRSERTAMSAELAADRQAWLETYRVAKLTVEAVLRQVGKAQLLPVIFHDLAVPASAKVTEMPAEPPA